MTDVQFKALVKICLTMAESTREVKDFKRMLVFHDSAFGSAFVGMLSRMTDALGSMEKVRQVLTDILMMEGGH
jgi:hypothetical protein